MTDQQIAKWIDQLQGELDTLKRTAGGGGSSVTITPSMDSGEKIADYSIDGVLGSLFARENLFTADGAKIGKWTDGSDLYVQVVSGNVTTAETTIALPNASGKNVKMFYPFLDAELSGGSFLLGMFTNSATDRFIMYYNNTNKLFQTYTSQYAGTAHIVVFYTVDQPTNRRKK